MVNFRKNISYGNESNKPIIDEIDRKILNLLQEDAKISNIQLSKEINLSPSSTLERVRKLEENDIISKYSVIINREKLNYNFSFLIRLRLKPTDHKSHEDFISEILQKPEVSHIYHISGEYNIILKVILEKKEDLTEFLLALKKNSDCIDSYIVDLVLGEVTQPFRLE